MAELRTKVNTSTPPAPARARRAVARETRSWLLFVHQLPSTPSNLRVKTWRRMQQLGAIAVKQAVYVLPDSPAAREDFEWLKTEIESAGGAASVFAAASVDAWSDDALVEEFRRSRQDAYASLAEDLETAIRRVDTARASRRRNVPDAKRLIPVFRERFAAIDRTDFFGSAGRDRVATLLDAIEDRIARKGGRGPISPPGGGTDAARYRGRTWVTRPRPGVDRMSSAWLIRRFIDHEARFGFVADREAAPADALPFDMFGVEFTHRGDHCTFETLCAVFGITDPAVSRIAAIVHDLDLKDGRFGAMEGPCVATLIEGLQLAYGEDEALLSQGMVLFEALYRATDRASRRAGPRAVAGKRKRPGTSRRE